MKTMKKVLIAIVPMFMAVAAFAQGKVEITSSKQTFVQSEVGSTTQFTFVGTDVEMNALKEKAATMRLRLTLESERNASGTYTCKLNVKQQNHAEYAAKMFLTLGFEKVTVDGTEKPVADLAADLTAMNK
jgi:hypothetical protein